MIKCFFNQGDAQGLYAGLADVRMTGKREADFSMHDCFEMCLNQEQMKSMSGLSLAYVGDAVYELMVRAWLCAAGSRTNGDLHAAAVRYVSAQAQAAFMEKLLPLLSEEETAVYKRGRNARVNAIPIHATPGQYHAATGFEALFGHLWLTGQHERLNELFNWITEENNAS